ncbi:MAG: hypothetical protein QOE65_1184 [Solirubrobacteraceae bacterium]|nr:hypothetical protein [Solirubrobacteraceae bacterium]
MWPAFGAFTLLDGLLIHARPLDGDATGLLPALILAAVFNLIAVAVLGRMGGWVLRRRRRDLPAIVAHDYAGTACLFAVAGVVALVGVLHSPAVDESRADFSAQSAAVHDYVIAAAPPEYRRNLRHADSLRLGADLYRTCVPGPDPRRALCLFVSTDQHPPGVRVDPNREPNRSFAPYQTP